MSIAAAWQFIIVPDGVADVEAEAEAVMGSLVDLEQVDDRLSDSAVGVDLAAMTLDVELTVKGDGYQDCVQHALAAIRTAIHSAGGATPGWPGPSAGGASFEPHDFRAVPA
jgi:hypothetical protein